MVWTHPNGKQIVQSGRIDHPIRQTNPSQAMTAAVVLREWTFVLINN